MERSRANAGLRRASERLYGDSRLRDNLTDEQAEQLLAWAITQVEEEVARTGQLPEEDAAPVIEARTDAVRTVLRLVNQMVAQLPQATQAQSREYVGQLVDALCEVDARTVQIEDMLALEDVVARREELAGSEIFEQLSAIVESPAAMEAGEAKPADEQEAAILADDGTVVAGKGSPDNVPFEQEEEE